MPAGSGHVAPKKKGDKDKKDKKKDKDDDDDDVSAAAAGVVVDVADGATLYVDGQRVPLTGATQSFNTPTLEPGKDYYYTMKAIAVRDGKTVTQTKRITVRAGETHAMTAGAMGLEQRLAGAFAIGIDQAGEREEGGKKGGGPQQCSRPDQHLPG